MEKHFRNLVKKEGFDRYSYQRSDEWDEIDDLKAFAMDCHLLQKERVGYSSKIAIFHHHYLNYAGYYETTFPTISSVEQEAGALKSEKAKKINDDLFDNIQQLYLDPEMRIHLERMIEGYLHVRERA